MRRRAAQAPRSSLSSAAVPLLTFSPLVQSSLSVGLRQPVACVLSLHPPVRRIAFRRSLAAANGKKKRTGWVEKGSRWQTSIKKPARGKLERLALPRTCELTYRVSFPQRPRDKRKNIRFVWTVSFCLTLMFRTRWLVTAIMSSI